MPALGIDQAAVRMAEKLYSRMSMTPDPLARNGLLQRISRLLDSYGHREIAIFLAAAIQRTIPDRRDPEERVALIAEISRLRQRYDCVEIALVEAQAAAESVDYPQNEARALAHLAELRAAHDTREMAAVEAGAIFRTLRRAPDRKRREALLARIAQIRLQHDHREIRLMLANALGCFMAGVPAAEAQASDHASMVQIVDELMSIDGLTFAEEHVRALRQAAAYTRDERMRRALSAQIAGVLLRFPAEQVAVALAEALLHTSAAGPVRERATMSEEIAGLAEQYPSVEIATLHAWALVLCVAEAEQDELIDGVGGVIASYDCDEIASEPAEELLHLAAISRDPQLRHEARNHIAKLRTGPLQDVPVMEQIERTLD